MANRLIGLELSTQGVRIAVLRRDRGVVTVIALEERPVGDATGQVAAVAALAGETFSLSDRLAAALPAGRAYVRTLRFPFKDRRKIQAAAPFELAAQLPVAMDNCTTALLWGQTEANHCEVVAAALPTAALSELLTAFDAAKVPLQVLDLMPFGLVAGIAGRLGTAILVCATGDETTVARVELGRLGEYRLIPGLLDPHNPQAVKQLVRECQILQHRGAQGEWPVYLTGAGVTPELLAALHDHGLRVTTFALTLGGKAIAPAFVPAVALALRSENHQDEPSFNLRQGQFACRSELRTVRRAAATAGGLLLLSLLMLGSAAFINYRDRARQAEALQREMVQMYQATFPGTALTADVGLQMESKLRELRGSVAALGIAGQPPPWRLLREVAGLPGQVPIEVEEFYCGREEARLSGTTDSFDAVNRIRDLLAKSALFSSVEVAESRKSLDGNRVNFRLRLPLAAKGGTP